MDLLTYAAGKTDTSREAFEGVDARTLRDQALAAIKRAGPIGLTADETADRLSQHYGSIRPRCTELKLSGKIIDSGQRRKNKNGKNMIVWVAA
ncbi:MAG: hypothetical protein NXI16_01380 [Alphaproteobacteria bacterium]|nr:hypothetical protein [Alphaproteobacteria bacterium]